MIYIFNQTLSQSNQYKIPDQVIRGLKVNAENYDSAVNQINQNKGEIVSLNCEALIITESPIKYIFKTDRYYCASTKPFSYGKIWIPAESLTERNNLRGIDLMIICHENWRIFRPLTTKAESAISAI